MIPRSIDWKNALANAIRDPAELLALLELPRTLLPAARMAAERFPLRVPRGYVARMAHADAADPLLRQVLPLAEELEQSAGFGVDPVGDCAAGTAPGLLHKYAGRALLITTGACAVHCRYCFRRHFPYTEHTALKGQWPAVDAYLRHQPEIEEVILSGGDPLMLDDGRLEELAGRLEGLGQLRRLRLHTRLPVVLPERVDAGLLGWLRRRRLPVVFVIHANHPNELDERCMAALRALREAGATVLNQAVLLRGVNDEASILAALSGRLFAAGVLPYYLHLLDRVAGAAHFEVEETAAESIMGEMRTRLPGYLVPRLVREQAGAPYKLPRG